MNARAVAVLVIAAAAPASHGYEWTTHNGVAREAVAFVKDRAGADQDLVAFLDINGKYMVPAAGCEGTPDAKGPETDEDYVEGSLAVVPGLGCDYKELFLGSFVTKDHFHPPLIEPFVGEDAIKHARMYFDWAVTLAVGARCDPSKKKQYEEWSANALGHALHLLADMSVPQHVRPENHLPYPLGHEWSFYEEWCLRLWDRPAFLPGADGSGQAVGHFQLAAQSVAGGAAGDLEALMEGQAAGARLSPWRGSNPWVLGDETQRTLAEAKYSIPSFEVFWERQGCGPELTCLAANGAQSAFFPGFAREHQGENKQVHRFGARGYDFEVSPSVVRDSPPPADDQLAFGINSLEISLRLWSEANPLGFDAVVSDSISGATTAAVGLIREFWDEVKASECDGCLSLYPCSSQQVDWGDDDEQDRCPEPPPAKPLPPDNDYPDENHGVVEGAVSVSPLENVGAISAHNTISLGAHWQEIARIGVRKGLTSLADFGRTMTLLAASDSLEAADEATQDVAFNEMRLLEAKYSAPRTRPEEELSKGAHVALFGTGFAEEAGKLLDALHQPYVDVGVNFDPLKLAEENEVLLVPSGGLQGMADDARLKERFTAYVARMAPGQDQYSFSAPLDSLC